MLCNASRRSPLSLWRVASQRKERITTARGWIGVASGKGSMKSLWELDGETHLHGHVEVPATIPDGAMLWIDLEVDGATETVSIAYR